MKTTVKFLLRLMLISFLVAIFGSGLGYTENIVSAKETIKFSNGDVYEGDVVNGTMHGKGVYI